MKTNSRALENNFERPLARTQSLVTQDLGDEMLVYDLKRNQAHCLNKSARLVWAQCDGRTSVKSITENVRNEIEGEIDTTWVLFALERLEKAKLLESDVTDREMKPLLTRRLMMRRASITAIATLPLVVSILAPTALAAASCRPTGAACTVSVECCTGVCNVNVCL